MKKLLIGLFLVLSWATFGQSSIQKNYFTTNDNPALSITNGNLISTNIYVSNVFATNITVNNITNLNEFHGRTEFVTNLFSTNAFITYITNITEYTTNLFATTEYVTNLNVTFITNQTLYTTNIFATTNFVTENFSTNIFSTNIFTTNLFATFITNNTFYTTNLFATTNINNFNITTNLFVSNSFFTNITVDLFTNNVSIITNLYVSNVFATNITVDVITNNLFITTNLFTSNAFITNLTVNNITNNTLITTNLFVSNVFATNITVDVITNNLFVTSNTFTTNLFVSNIFTTNITLMAAIWNTNKWNGPTNDVSFKATYQSFVASTDMEITGYIDSNATNANTSVLELDPGGANRVLYFPAVFTNFTSDGMNAYLIPSTNKAVITLFQYGNIYTNVTFRLFGPGTLGDTNFAYTDKPNAFTTASSNYFAGAVTISTNLCNGVPDFSVEESLFSTNNAIVFAAPVGVDLTKKTVQWLLVNTTNTTAAVVPVTPPVNCHGQGTLYCTNWTQCWFQCYGGAITNMIAVPIF